MWTYKDLLIFLAFFMLYSSLPNINSSINQSEFIYMDIKNPKLKKTVFEDQIICTKPIERHLRTVWSSAYLEIKSKSQCSVHEGINTTNIEESRKDYSSLINKVISKLRSFQLKNDEYCHHIVYVPIYEKYCVAVVLKGELEVEYVLNHIEYKLVILTLVGAFLYFFSEKLSRSITFHYASGISLGVVGSVLILVIIMIRFIPKKTTAVFTVVSCSSFLAFLAKWTYSNFKDLGETFQKYIFYYLALSAFISAIYCYYRGPISNPKAINIINLLLKIFGLILVVNGINIKMIPFALFVSIFLISFLQLSFNKFKESTLVNKIKFRYFPEKRRLLTQEEFNKEADEYTAKALEELKLYCRSPECNTWKIVSRISKPDRFAKFIQNNESHLSDDELMEYEKYEVSTDLIDNDDEEDIEEL